jgi:hypothetical protein
MTVDSIFEEAIGVKSAIEYTKSKENFRQNKAEKTHCQAVIAVLKCHGFYGIGEKIYDSQTRALAI